MSGRQTGCYSAHKRWGKCVRIVVFESAFVQSQDNINAYQSQQYSPSHHPSHLTHLHPHPIPHLILMPAHASSSPYPTPHPMLPSFPTHPIFLRYSATVSQAASPARHATRPACHAARPACHVARPAQLAHPARRVVRATLSSVRVST